MSVGAATASSDALAVLPDWVGLVDVIAVVVLLNVPPAVAVTSAVIVQFVLAGTVAPDSEIDDEFATAVTVPPHVVERLLGVATFRFVGSESLNATPVRSTVFGLPTVKLIWEVFPTTIDDGVNDVAACRAGTSSVVEAVPPAPAVGRRPEVSVCGPAAVPLIVTRNRHWPPLVGRSCPRRDHPSAL